MSEVSTGVVAAVKKTHSWRTAEHDLMVSDPFGKDKVLTLTDRGKDRFFSRYAVSTKHADGTMSDVWFHDGLSEAVTSYLAACRREDVKP